jgi:hypothetical protein
MEGSSTFLNGSSLFPPNAHAHDMKHNARRNFHLYALPPR